MQSIDLFPPYYLPTISFIFGALVGSFLNVVIYRMPKGLSIVHPGSMCTSCRTPIRWYDNIPIVSYFLLGGRCRSCKAPYSLRYPAVEALTALLSLGLMLKYRADLPTFGFLFLFVAMLIAIAFIDYDLKIIPNRLSYPGIVIGLAGSMVLPGHHILDSLLGVLLGGGILFFIAYTYEYLRKVEGMGMGDVKLLAMIGAFLGWRSVLDCLMISSITGSVFGIAAMAIFRRDAKYALPFGPFLAFAALFPVFLGSGIISKMVLILSDLMIGNLK